MSIRSQRYIIKPASACPAHLRDRARKPVANVTLDPEDVARVAWNEILQTAPHSTSLFSFIEDLLEPGAADLIWRGNGPGRGTEMRRSFSGLFGRFFARAYLQAHHGFVWFAAIDGDDFHLSPNWRVHRKRGSKTEMPDWVCARPGALGIAEAKGSHQKGNATRGGLPGPIRTAAGQIGGVLVQKKVRVANRTAWRNRSVKGWAVMSRWGLAHPSRDPFLYALDPDTDGEKLSPPETKNLVQAVARIHVEQTALGLGLLKPTEDGFVPTAQRIVSLDGDPTKETFFGVVISPFGPLDLDAAQARTLSELLPDPGLIRFVGLETTLFRDYLEGRPLASRGPRRVAERALIGGDGLVIAPVKQIVDRGVDGDQT